jgi:hypothetical protein
MPDGMIEIQACRKKRLRDTGPVKFQPDVFPGLFFIRPIGIDLLGNDHKSLSGTDLMGMDLSQPVSGFQRAPSGKNIVKKIMVSDGGSETVGRSAFLSSELKYIDVYELAVLQVFVIFLPVLMDPVKIKFNTLIYGHDISPVIASAVIRLSENIIPNIYVLNDALSFRTSCTRSGEIKAAYQPLTLPRVSPFVKYF